MDLVVPEVPKHTSSAGSAVWLWLIYVVSLAQWPAMAHHLGQTPELLAACW